MEKAGLKRKNVVNNFDLENDQLIWFLWGVEWKHVDVRNFFFGEPMILEGLVKYDRIGIFCGKKLQSFLALLRFTMFTCCDSDIPLPFWRSHSQLLPSVVWLLRGQSYWWKEIHFWYCDSTRNLRLSSNRSWM